MRVEHLAEEIISRTERGDGCWEWTGAHNGRGYGRIGSGYKQFYCHRVVCEAYHGLPDGYHACHRCDNPACVRPDHLFPGTAKDNIHDAMAKGRASKPPPKDWAPIVRANAHHWQKITTATASEIKRRLAAGERNCDVAAALNVSTSIIEKIKAGQRWRHAP